MSEAAAACGVNGLTVKHWLKKGLSTDPADRPYRMFRQATEKARGEAPANLLAKVYEAADDDWKAAMAILSARYPKRWGRRPRTVILQNNMGAIAQDMPQEELNRLLLDVLKNPEISRGLPVEERAALLQLVGGIKAMSEVVNGSAAEDISSGSGPGGPEFYPEGVVEVSEGCDDGEPESGPGE
jgi:hypothetical protein